MANCNWCTPGKKICGTCKKFFDYYGDGSDKCSANYTENLCAAYEPIDYCPKCGRKLVQQTEKGEPQNEILCCYFPERI